MMNKLLEVSNLSKTYHTLSGEITTVNNLSFYLLPNEFLSIIGTSGCGKSTILNILSGIDIPSSGHVKINVNNIGYMQQEDALFPWLNILDNALIGLKITNNL